MVLIFAKETSLADGAHRQVLSGGVLLYHLVKIFLLIVDQVISSQLLHTSAIISRLNGSQSKLSALLAMTNCLRLAEAGPHATFLWMFSVVQRSD